MLAAAAAVGVAGVTPWLAFALRIDPLYRPILKGAGYRAAFHPVAEVQGFLSLVAVGILFAGVPRWTGAPEARRWQCALVAACGFAAAVAAWADRWDLSQAAWTGLLAVAAWFALARRRWISGAVDGRTGTWLASAAAAAIAGAVLAAVGARDPRGPLHDAGRGLLWQGVFTALTLAAAASARPKPGEGDPTPTSNTPSVMSSPSPSPLPSPFPSSSPFPLLHALGAALLLLTFALDALVSRRAGFAARAAVTLAVAAGPALA
ncbi:MAG TPA: hypothetical protein VFP65_06645, partial [Anaeromyxobacteraceae bacterium]|nr:hypothetical protein [Anaeromyxobacteraceae bacterium]